MWEFMTEYANNFYAMADEAREVFKVLFAWGLALIPIGLIASATYLILWEICEKIKDKYKELKKNQQED